MTNWTKKAEREAKVKSRAFTITTRNANRNLVISEVPDRTCVVLSIFDRSGGGQFSVELNPDQWEAVGSLRYDIEVKSLEVEEEAAPVDVVAAPLGVPGVPPEERTISLEGATVESTSPGDGPCPDGLPPDGVRCPRCGGRRAPSGVGGGSWVHVEDMPF